MPDYYSIWIYCRQIFVILKKYGFSEGMNNFSYILFLFLLVASVKSTAQEGIILMPIEQDSASIEIGKQIEYRQLISGQLLPGLQSEKIELSGFNFKDEFDKRYAFNINLHSFGSMPYSGFSAGTMSPFYSPFYQNGMVLSEGAYRLGEKFTFGGFSYGANSMLMPPPVPGINKFNSYGSTMFMQYKVGKNFKIETRVNVSQGGLYPVF